MAAWAVCWRLRLQMGATPFGWGLRPTVRPARSFSRSLQTLCPHLRRRARTQTVEKKFLQSNTQNDGNVEMALEAEGRVLEAVLEPKGREHEVVGRVTVLKTMRKAFAT